jgi:hypothetical protein
MPDQVAYSHDVAKFPDAGLQLNLPVDLVPMGQYSYFTNALSRIEGEVSTRDGLSKICDVGAVSSPIHSLFRLNEIVPGINGARMFGILSQLWTAPLPAGNVPVQLTQYIVAGTGYPAFPVSFDGTPLSMMTFRFDADPQAWVIIANGQKMMKFKAQYYEQLGLPAPTVQPIASVGGGAGLTGDYFWQYTYVNAVTLSESNPSVASMASGGGSTLEIRRPTSNQTPTARPQGGGGVFIAVSNPGSAYDNNLATYAEGIGNSPGNGVANARFLGFASASVPYSSLELHIVASAPSYSQVSGVIIEYSLDAGATWNTAMVAVGGGSVPQQEYIVSLPVGQDLTQIVVYMGAGESFAGVTNDLRVNEIWTQGVPSASGGGALTLTNQSAVICVAPPVDPQETAIRLYRIGGTLSDAYRFVSQENVSDLVQGACGAGMLEIDDDTPDAGIEANPLLDIDNDMPVSSVQVVNQTLKYIWGFDERVLGVGDPGRPESVYFSKRGLGDAFPPQNWVIVSEPGTEMMSGFSWNLRCWAWSRERLYTLVLNVIQGETFTPQETQCRRGLKGRWAFCVGEKGVYFIAKDGPFRTGGGPEESIADDFVRPLFPTYDAPGRSVNGYEAIDMDDENGLRLERHNSEIWFDYTGATSGTRQTLIYDERKNRWRGYYRGGATTSKAQTHYSELGTVSRLLTGGVENTVFEGQLGTDDNGADIDTHIRTGARDQGQPLNLKEYGDVIFDLDPGGADNGEPVVITPYINADAQPQAAINVTGSGRQRVALNLAQAGLELYGLNISFDIQWSTKAGTIAPTLYQMDILYRIEPAAMKHWEVPPNSLGMQGFMHVRDGYVTIRSTADVTLTFTPDVGSEQTITLPSTSGEKQKLYFSFAANKQKLVGFSFDSAQDFRIYQPESELRAKQWVTDLGYSVAPLFGAETP